MKISILLLILTGFLFSQPSWKRTPVKESTEKELFHSTFVVNLPTSETIQQGNLEFEISHRFLPAITDGFDVLYGLDGPVNMRIALGYGITDNLFLTAGRSNVNDNYDLWLKYRLVGKKLSGMPFSLGFRLGSAWNSEVPGRNRGDSHNFQLYEQFIVNTLTFQKKLGLGVVLTQVQNANYLTLNRESSTSTGGYIHYYATALFGFFLEYNANVAGYTAEYNTLTLGLQLETGGHFFKLFITNNSLLNPAQNVVGSDLNWQDGDFRIGFGITRAIRFKK